MSPLLFIVYMNWIDKCNQAEKRATIGNCKISRLLFADDLVLLSSSESGLQQALNSFADACDTAKMKISTAKTEVLHLSRNLDQCVLQAGPGRGGSGGTLYPGPGLGGPGLKGPGRVRVFTLSFGIAP